ncbi:putative membrane protein [Exiguobacterium sp. S17]|nr:putative membrane protein [Exiguobacterium sp. S17]
MSRSYILVLLSVFALFFLQLYGDDLQWALPVSIALVALIVGATLFQLRRKPNR